MARAASQVIRPRSRPHGDAVVTAGQTSLVHRVGSALGAALIVIALGLALRFYGRGLGLPALVVKYGGSVLWAAMVYFLLAALLPRQPQSKVALLALVIAVLVELIRLMHTPWLDSFRLTLTGALLLGRIFSVWDILAYAVGIVLALGLDWATVRSHSFPGEPSKR